jgi:osmotically inducible protein OsmC
MKSTANTQRVGNLQACRGALLSPSTILNQTLLSFKTRFGSGIRTNSEELIAAADAGYLTRLASVTLNPAGFLANDLNTEAIPDVDMAELRSLVFYWI